ncbi:hypothetical protein [Methylocucumis oryzae]|nr:hypothetical protein [Methylocucumis oryzae]
MLLIGTGFYTTPWLNFIDQDATAIERDFPMHQSNDVEPDAVLPE